MNPFMLARVSSLRTYLRLGLSYQLNESRLTVQA